MEEPFCPFDGSCDELREERYEHRETQQVIRWLKLLPVDVDRVRHRLEGVEADTDWQDDIEGRNVGIEPYSAQQVGGRVNKEPEVFEETQDADVHPDRST